MPLYSDHITNMYYGGSPSYSAPYSYSSSVLPGSYSASYLNPGGTFSNHSSIGGYRKPITSRWVTSSGRNYSPILGTITERASGSPVRINSPRRIPLSKRSYIAASYVPRPININTADIDVSRDKYRYKKEKTPPPVACETPVDDNGPFMPRVDGKPETGIDSSPGTHKSTIRRGRTVVRLTTIKRKERDSPRKPQVSDPEIQAPLVAELTQSSKDDENDAQAEPESLGWREKLAEDLAYKDKREKKTLGAKLVEKFIVKDSDANNSTKETNITKDTQNLPVPSEPKRSTSRSPDRRCSIEMLAEQANLLDSLIRNENLSTARLDLSKVGIEEESKSNTEQTPLIKRRRSSQENSLQTTKSDYSLHESLNSLRDPKDPKHFSKRRSLKKSMSGGSICRLDSIKEFPRELINSESDLPAIDENRQSIKINIKQKPKMKAILTSSSVDISEPVKSPLKFKVDDVVVEETVEKPRSPKKELTYTVDEELLPEVEAVLCTNNDFVFSTKKKENLTVMSNEDNQSVSPEPDDGNFWDKIGKRETVYLMRRKNILDEDRQKKRALYWFPENEEHDNANSEIDNSSPSDSVKVEDILEPGLKEEKIDDIPKLESKTENTSVQNINKNSCCINEEEETHNLLDGSMILEDNSKNLVSGSEIKNEPLNSEKSGIKKILIQDHTHKIPELKTVIKTKLVRKSPDKSKSEIIVTEKSNTLDEVETNTTEVKKTDNISLLPSKGSQKKVEDATLNECSLVALKVETTETKQPTEDKKSSPKKVSSTPRKGKVSPEKKKGSPKKDAKDSTQTASDMECNKCKKKIPTKTSPTDKLAMKTGDKKVIAPASKTSDASKIKSSKNGPPSTDSSRSKADQNNASKTPILKDVAKTKSQDNENTGLSREKTETKEQIQNTVSTTSNNVDADIKNAGDNSKHVSKLINPESENIPNTENQIKSGLLAELEKREDNKADNNSQKPEDTDTKQQAPKEVVQPVPKPIRKPVKEELAPRPLIATPRPLQKKVPQVIHSSSSESSSEEDSSDDDADESDSSEESTEFYECESNPDGRTSTGSNDSGFDSSAPTSPAGFVTIKKGGDSPGPSTAPAQADTASLLEQELEQSTAYGIFKKTGRFTPPARSIPRFRKYNIEDFHFIKVLGKGSFGKVLLTELRDTEYYYAVKCLKKDVVLEDDDVECTLIERKVLALGTNHPYLCHLFATFQTDKFEHDSHDNSHLFFVMEYLNGGDLMFHIQQSGRFPESRARFYAAEIVSGLKFLHKRGIVYRDLKLDNILLDYEGHVRIADFGMCKLQIYLEKTADTFCGTPDYMAPEIIKGQKYNQTVDWWSFGVLLYEMLIGQSPFSGCDEDELFWSICNEMPSYPRFLSQEALTILTRLLDKDARTRLGGTDCMHGDVRDQDFFHSLSWDKLERRELEAPFKPRVRHPLDTQYFDRAFTGERPRLTAVEPNVLRSMDQEPFRGFSYTNPNATDR